MQGIGAVVLVMLLGAGPASGERGRGLELAGEGRCVAALEELEPALRARPDDAQVLLVAGTCQARLERHTEALASLDRARALDPSLPGIDLRLGVVLFHLGDSARAREAFDRAEQRGTTAELLLYRGLLALDARSPGEAEDAARLFEAARRLDPALAPAADYYAGIAHRAAGREDRARERFEAVLERSPDSIWRVDAERALSQGPEPRRPWAELMAGLEWDDNVVLRGSGVVLPSEISSERDLRGVWSAAGGGPILERGNTTLNGRIGYFGRAHRDLSQFDSHYPTAALWLDHRLLPETWLRGLLVAGYGWVDGAPFVSNHLAAVSLVQEGPRSQSSLGVEFHRDNFRFRNDDVPDGPGVVGAPCLSPSDLLCGPPGLDESRARNRDGYGLRLRTDHAFDLAQALPSLDLGYAFHHFSARGREYSFDAHELRVGTGVALPLAFELGLSGLFSYRTYRHPTTFPSTQGLFANRQYGLPERDRRERSYEARVDLTRPIAPRTVLGVRWSYLRNQSSEEVFDYRRHVVGVYVTLRIGGE